MENIQKDNQCKNMQLSKEKVFTQEELNTIIKKRLERAQVKWEKEHEQRLQDQKNKLIHEQMKFKVVEIEIDKIRYLKAGMNTIISLEKELKRPLSELSEGTITLADMRTMFYCLLKEQDKKLTLEKVGDLMDLTIDAHGLDYLFNKLLEVMTGSLGENSAVPLKQVKAS